MIDELTTAIYTCGEESGLDAKIVYGKVEAATANLKEGEQIRKIKTTNKNGWGVYT